MFKKNYVGKIKFVKMFKKTIVFSFLNWDIFFLRINWSFEI